MLSFPTLRALALSSVLLAFSSFAPASESAPTAALIPASDARFRYEGRFDESDPSTRGVIWQASRIYLDFAGDTLALRFDQPRGENFFDAEIDGHKTLVEIPQRGNARGAEFSGLGAGRHHLMLFKRSEASAGSVRFRGVELATGAQAFAPAPPAYKLRIEFFGDSITAAACNEDGAADQWNDRRTHNAALGYAAFTAAALNADHRNIAVSGMGIVNGYTPVKAGEMWNHVQPTATSPAADLTKWIPDVVFINLGENDDSRTRGQPFPDAAYIAGYTTLVHNFRQAYPTAQIVILRGGMFGGSQSERLRTPWEKFVAQIEAADPHVTHFVFQHWSRTHPRVADHRAMADELIAWLRPQPFMKSATR